MSYNWSVPEKRKEFEPVPAGNYPARCYSIVDLGSQETNFDGIKALKRQVRVFWELPTKKKVFKEGEEAKPCVVSSRYTLSFNAKSNLRHVIESWIGRKLTDKEVYDGSWKLPDLLGLPCLVTVGNEEGKDGNTYARVMAVAPMVEGMQCPPQVNATKWFFMGHKAPFTVDAEAFATLSPFIKDTIVKSPEYQSVDGGLEEFLDAVA